jgi:serine O-acetyltransferase
MGFIRTIRQDLAAHSHRPGWSALPAALLFSPGFLLIFSHRLAKWLYGFKLSKILGRVLWRLNVLFSGCHIGLRSEIGPGVRFPHPVGIVIGDGVLIGSNVTIYQSVTVGAASFSKLNYPVIGDDVTIYPGAVLVGAIKVGSGSAVGANAFVRTDVPAGAVFVTDAAKQLGGGSA